MKKAFTLILLLCGAVQAQQIDPEGFNKRGFIRNAVSEQCWYTQIYEKTNPHFHPSQPHMTNQNLRTLSFDVPDCMAESIDGLDAAEIVNKTMIANMISDWFVGTYVTADMRYDTRNRKHPGSFLQERGECMMAPGYPATAIAIEFVSDNDSITDVVYAPTYDCGEAL